MQLQQIRNATNKLTYGGKVFLIDPWLMPRHQFSFVDVPGMPYHVEDKVKENLPMPFFNLPLPIEEILAGVDYYVITHIHPDHIDMAMDGTVGGPLDKNVPVICQNEEDAAVLRRSGFQSVTVLSKDGAAFGGVQLTQVPARHGTVIPCGEAMGVVFSHADEKTFYLAGDTVWYPEVQNTLRSYNPGVVALNCCAAELIDNGRLIMDAEDVDCVYKTVPHAQLYLTHLDNVAHAALTRLTLRAALVQRNVQNYTIPADGETVQY